jgi:hypothetical protein
MKWLIAILLTCLTVGAQEFIPFYGGEDPVGNNLLTGLAAQYKFDEVSGNALDSSGIGNDLTVVGAAAAGSGRIGGARAVDTSNYYYHADDSIFEIGSGSFTVAFWVKLGIKPAETNPATYQVVISKQSQLVGSWAIFAVGSDDPLGSGHTSGNGFSVEAYNDLGFPPGGSAPYVLSYANAGEWYFVCYRRDADLETHTLTVYDEDGTSFEDSQPFVGSGYAGTEPLMIGGYSASATTLDTTNYPISAGSYFDELGFWPRALSDCEVAKLASPVARDAYNTLTCEP